MNPSQSSSNEEQQGSKNDAGAVVAPLPLATHGPLSIAGSASRSIAMLDRRIALAVTLLPAAGTLAAIVAWLAGYGPSAIEWFVFGALYAATAVGIEVGFHRHITHRAFDAHPWVRSAFIAFGSMGVQGPVIWWAATHRRHHASTDVNGDAHSPNLSGDDLNGRIRGIWHSHMGWLFVGSCTRPDGWERYAPDLYRDPLVLRHHMAYYRWVVFGSALAPVICGLVGRSWTHALLGFLWGDMVRVFAVSHCIWAVNSLCHLVGRRDFHTTAHDRSRNNLLVAITTFGQGWHNNHHAFPASAYMGLRWWQIDLGGLLIRILESLHLASNVRRVDEEMMAKKRIYR